MGNVTGDDMPSRSGGAETGQSIGICWQDERGSVKVDQHTCGTGKSLLYTIRDDKSLPVSFTYRANTVCLPIMSRMNFYT